MKEERGSIFVVERAGMEDSSYQMEMLRKNRPWGLLPVQICAINETYECYYESGNRKCLSEYLAQRTIDGGMFRWMIDSVKKVLFSVEEYLLEMNCICMEPQHIYIEEKETEPELMFCYVPVVQVEFENGFRKLLQFFLEKLDYNDREVVTMGYQVYQNVMREGYSSVFSLQIMENTGERKESDRLQEENRRLQQDNFLQPERQPQSWKPQQSEDGQVVFPWEEEEKENEDVMEKRIIYILGIILCGLAAAFCYWQGSLVWCGIVLLLTAVVFYVLIRYGRRDKGIDSVENTW